MKELHLSCLLKSRWEEAARVLQGEEASAEAWRWEDMSGYG